MNIRTEYYKNWTAKQEELIKNQSHLVCGKCKESKPIEMFTLSRRKHSKNPPCKICDRESNRTSYRKNIKKYLVRNAKVRAKSNNLEFCITESDILIPDKCPLLEIPIFITSGIAQSDNSPSIDRIDPRKGYTKDNVWIISAKANRIKNDATITELTLLIRNLLESLKL